MADRWQPAIAMYLQLTYRKAVEVANLSLLRSSCAQLFEVGTENTDGRNGSLILRPASCQYFFHPGSSASSVSSFFFFRRSLCSIVPRGSRMSDDYIDRVGGWSKARKVAAKSAGTSTPADRYADTWGKKYLLHLPRDQLP